MMPKSRVVASSRNRKRSTTLASTEERRRDHAIGRVDPAKTRGASLFAPAGTSIARSKAPFFSDAAAGGSVVLDPTYCTEGNAQEPAFRGDDFEAVVALKTPRVMNWLSFSPAEGSFRGR